MLKEEISERFSTISKICRPMTNCYSMQIFDAAEELWNVEESFIFSYNDHGIHRLVYFAKDLQCLKELLKLPRNKQFCMDVMTKDSEFMQNFFQDCNCNLLAKMTRLVNADCRNFVENSVVSKYRDDSLFFTATQRDVPEINKKLWAVFDSRISHLLNDDELMAFVKKENLYVHHNSLGVVDAVLQLDVMPKKFYINQVINESGTPVIHSMMIKALNCYVRQGGKYIYSWVDEKNVPSQKFHAKYGMIHDGMWNLVFTLER